MQRRVARYYKPAAFIAVVALLFVFSQVSIPLTVTQYFQALPETARSRVMVTSINGASMTAPGTSMSEDASPEPEPITFQTSNLTDNEALIQSDLTLLEGCNTEFRYDVNISFTTANELTAEAQATANVTVYEVSNGKLMGSQLVSVDLKPGVPQTTTLSFYLSTPEADPIFRVRVSFPTGADLGPVTTTYHMSLLEYVLVKTGLLNAKAALASSQP
ncbi:MAG TPA: hypothetical protein VMS77_07105 [Conexivisphaerales archaeon]|nr:hypothetical protein [Conexivisphaerales archaeon]